MRINGVVFEEAAGHISKRLWQLRIPLPEGEYVNFFRDFGAEMDPLVLSQFVTAVERGLTTWMTAQTAEPATQEPARIPASQLFYTAGVGSGVKDRAS
jgi:hypothetical protein